MYRSAWHLAVDCDRTTMTSADASERAFASSSDGMFCVALVNHEQNGFVLKIGGWVGSWILTFYPLNQSSSCAGNQVGEESKVY